MTEETTFVTRIKDLRLILHTIIICDNQEKLIIFKSGIMINADSSSRNMARVKIFKFYSSKSIPFINILKYITLINYKSENMVPINILK